MTIIINNVYAFQYPTKNRCTILVQPSFAKLVLLPIREAYEWKRSVLIQMLLVNLILLPIREAYEWKHFAAQEEAFVYLPTCFQFVKRMNGNIRDVANNPARIVKKPCFQFVKRMNGNTNARKGISSIFEQSCFQFVKRMNGNCGR